MSINFTLDCVYVDACQNRHFYKIGLYLTCVFEKQKLQIGAQSIVVPIAQDCCDLFM